MYYDREWRQGFQGEHERWGKCRNNVLHYSDFNVQLLCNTT